MEKRLITILLILILIAVSACYSTSKVDKLIEEGVYKGELT